MRVFEREPGLAAAVFRGKYARVNPEGDVETFAERVRAVIDGSSALVGEAPEWERERFHELAVAGVMVFAGRHLQHGDAHQRQRTMEYFANCAVGAARRRLVRRRRFGRR
jgi:hypothetical protein